MSVVNTVVDELRHPFRIALCSLQVVEENASKRFIVAEPTPKRYLKRPKENSMGHHTFDAAKAENLEDAARYRYLSAEELLWALDLSGDETVADLGSGTGFYTDDVAPFVERVWAVDLQSAMHEQYREKGVPENVDLVTTDVADLPFADDGLDAAFSTMTYHEFASDESLAELARVVRPGGRLVIADWAASGEGESGPPADERYSLADAVTALEEAGFAVEFEALRTETFVVTATR